MYGCEIYSSDGSLLVLQGRKVHGVRATESTSLVSRMQYRSPTRCISVPADSSRIAVGESAGLVSVRSRGGGSLVSVAHESSVRCVSFSPRRNDLLSGSEQSVRLTHPEQQTSTRIGISSACMCLTWDCSGICFVYCLANGNVVYVDSNQVHSPIWTISTNSTVWCCTFQTNNELVLGSWDHPALVQIHSHSGTITHKTPLPNNPTCLKRVSDDMVLVGDSQGTLTLYGNDSDSYLVPLLQLHFFDQKSFITSICGDFYKTLFVSTFRGDMAALKMTSTLCPITTAHFHILRDPQCLSRVLIWDLTQEDPPIHPTLIYSKSSSNYLVTGLAASDNRIALMVDFNKIVLYSIEKNSVTYTRSIDIPKNHQNRANLVSLTPPGIIVFLDCGKILWVNENGKLVYECNDLVGSSRIQFVQSVSKNCWLLCSTIGDIFQLFLSQKSHQMCLRLHLSTSCHQIISFNLSFSCIALLQRSGDMFIYENGQLIFTRSNIIGFTWNNEIDGLLCCIDSSGSLFVWDRFSQTLWQTGTTDRGNNVIDFRSSRILVANNRRNNSLEYIHINLSRPILEICEMEGGLERAYMIAMRSCQDAQVYDFIASGAISLGDWGIAKFSFMASNNLRGMFLVNVLAKSCCSLALVDFSNSKFEQGAKRLWDTGTDDMREVCISTLVRFKRWSLILTLAGPDRLRLVLDNCDDRRAAGQGFLEMELLDKALSAFMDAGANELVMKCVTDENIDRAIEFFDTVDDWERLRILVLRAADPYRICVAYAKRNRWEELKELCESNKNLVPWYLMLHGKHLVDSQTDVIGGLWEQIRSDKVDQKEISCTCRVVMRNYANAKNFHFAACICAMDPFRNNNHDMVYYAYGIVISEYEGKSPFAQHDHDLVLNAALFLYNLGTELIREVIDNYDAHVVENILLQRLFESGCIRSARSVFRGMSDHSLLPQEMVADLGAVCADITFCEDDPDYRVCCPICDSDLPLICVGDKCTACARSFVRELCLFDIIRPSDHCSERTQGREILIIDDMPMITCLYCRNVFSFYRYLDDSKCMICHCEW